MNPMIFFRKRSTPLLALLWIFSLWWLHQDVVSHSFLTKDAFVDVVDGALIMRQDYLGYYLGGKKVGFASFILKEDSEESVTRQAGKYYVFRSNSALNVQAMGANFEIQIRHFGEVNEDLTVRSFRFDFDASGQQLYVRGIVKDHQLELTTTSEGDVSTQTFPLDKPLYHAELIHLLVARKGLNNPDPQKYTVYNPMTMSFGQVVARVVGKENINLLDREQVQAYKLKIDFMGMETNSWIGKDGELYKEESQISGINFTAIRETKEQALDMDFVSKDLDEKDALDEVPDLIEVSRIKTDTRFSHPEAVSQMTIKVTGVTPEQFVFHGDYQRLTEENKDSFIVSIQQRDYDRITSNLPNSSPPYEVNDESLEEYLKDEPLINATHPRIREKALEITGDTDNPWQASVQLATWLYDNITKEMRTTMPHSLEVLNSMRGDCNEHSTLFTALARSIGIPTKICAGLVYQNDGFYYHAWNEVLVNGEWLPIDSTLNRIEMDAAHIKLSEGNFGDQSAMTRMIGKLDVEILSYEEND